MRPKEHYRAAEALLNEGKMVLTRIRELADAREQLPLDKGWETSRAVVRGELTRGMDELGKKAMGIWAQAQVHATLAGVG